jgi:uncharacterized protein (DUF1919 family)
VCENGTLNDLFDLKDKLVKSVILFLCFICWGCVTTPEIHTTKPWENHYTNINDFYKNTENITLE